MTTASEGTTSAETSSGSITDSTITASPTGSTTLGSTGSTTADTTTTTGELCEPSAPQGVGPQIVLGPVFTENYAAFILGPVPGLPSDAYLGGIALAEEDDNTLLIAGFAETSEGGLYSIGVTRGECGHITGFDGEASLVAKASDISDILVLAGGPIIYSEWNSNYLSQRVEGMDMPVRTDLSELTPPIPKSVAGFGLVPPGLAAAGELRVLSWDTGDWYHLARQPKGETFTFLDPEFIDSLDNKSGGLAYVPAGSPGFLEPHVPITRPERNDDHVVVFQVDPQGDPLPETLRVLISELDMASNAYFDRVSGDLLLSTIETDGDRIYIVQGFAQPPPLQP